jgi:L-lactate dehydrogenase (cytochrome)
VFTRLTSHISLDHLLQSIVLSLRSNTLPNMAKTFTYDEVKQHNTTDSTWVVLYGNVWDVTKFLPEHPGGSKIILQLAGTDATEEYDPIHPPGTLEGSLPAEAKLGKIDESTLPKEEKAPAQESGSVSPQVQQQVVQREWDPDTVDECLNIDDLEHLATKTINKKAWAYYYSAGDDLYSKSYNGNVYNKILLRPRIFVDCTRCDTSTTLLGNKVNLPIYIAPAAMARLGNPAGEAGMAAAAAKFGAMQLISANASQTPEQIVANAPPGQVFGWQLYVQQDRAKSEAMLARVNAIPQIKFICLTLDAPVPGKREHDERSKNVAANLPVRSSIQSGSASETSPAPDSASARSESAQGGVGKALFAGTAPDLTWRSTLPWLAKHTSLPIVLKGLQTHEDAYLASHYSQYIKGIILSNHGGRALDTAPPALHTLLEIRKFCPEVLTKLEVWVDGGIKRGTDVVKALALGAKGVGLGRAPLFALGAGGQAGVERMFEILKAETETAMRLLGCERIEELSPRHVNTRALERDIFDGEAGLEGAVLRSKL